MLVNHFSCVRCLLLTEPGDSHISAKLLIPQTRTDTRDFWGPGSECQEAIKKELNEIRP